MSITYPLSMPGAPGPRNFKMTPVNLVGENLSPFTGTAEEQQWQGEWWEIEFGLPMLTRSQAMPWIAFLESLRGKYGTFLAGDPLGAAPRGAFNPINHNPVVRITGGVAAGAFTIPTGGWLGNISGMLLPGDYLQITAPGSPQRLYRNLTSADTDSTGHMTLDVFPRVREAIPDQTEIILINTMGTFRLLQNQNGWGVDQTRMHTIDFKAREAL